ncbi:putative quinol monooxygenase [Roseiconus lacunae]|uniref:Quinol monooxygenase n=1 Tax=Roseiconus lacunae TaxID=2605694 RepID=A0ABT7PGB1_9BACT|nr:putative quinol monooxygenase [Roseiconus lacunae]MCD0460438.1 antibiotic biosynthesis monooxygenase [Roseiconus lacunae]MDM4015515.1 putative quinol monooxygenase [Roseiconus lacunae]WRQ52808.1 putative quinol monooxygenase [Stieleria sp. HD01]
MKHPSFAIAVTFEIKPEHRDAFLQRVLQQASDSVRLEDGCFQFDVLVDEDNPNIVFLYETYADAAAFDTHRATDHFADFSQQVADWVASKTLRRLVLQETPS